MHGWSDQRNVSAVLLAGRVGQPGAFLFNVFPVTSICDMASFPSQNFISEGKDRGRYL